MNEKNIHTLFSTLDALPSLPVVVTQVLSVTSEPESSAKDLMEVILPDQSMCATILKMANSAFFGLPRKVDTLEKAVMVLGFNEVRNIVLGKAVFNSFKQLTTVNKADIENFWDHSFTCGLAAKIIAEDLGRNPSELFIGGLLHDIGKLPLLMTYEGSYQHLLKLAGPLQFNSAMEENELFSISHDTVGRKLLNQWLFPRELVAAVGYHHSPDQSPESQLNPMIIQMADILSLMLYNPKEIEPHDIKIIIQDFHPEIVTLWSENLLSYEDKLESWFHKLREGLETDAAIQDIFRA